MVYIYKIYFFYINHYILIKLFKIFIIELYI